MRTAFRSFRKIPFHSRSLGCLIGLKCLSLQYKIQNQEISTETPKRLEVKERNLTKYEIGLSQDIQEGQMKYFPQ